MEYAAAEIYVSVDLAVHRSRAAYVAAEYLARMLCKAVWPSYKHLFAIFLVKFLYAVKLVKVLYCSDHAYPVEILEVLQGFRQKIQRGIYLVWDIFHVEVHLVEFGMAVMY